MCNVDNLCSCADFFFLFSGFLAVLNVGTLKTLDWKTRDLKSIESVTIFKRKSYGAEIKKVYGDDSADDTDASTNAVVATVITPATDSNDCEVCLVAHRDPRIALVSCGHQRFCEPCANEVERQGRGCPICRTDIQMILRLF